MTSRFRLTRADEESRYFSVINALTELDHEFRVLELPDDALELLHKLIETARQDFRSRFSR